jgi:ketohexokinase
MDVREFRHTLIDSKDFKVNYTIRRYVLLTSDRVPHFPKEDTKLRAQKVVRRRGGNTANTLEVLSDILRHAPSEPYYHLPESEMKLHLISVLPDEQSQDAEYVRGSIPDVQIPGLWRKGHQHAASSMIIQSKRDDTRTIVSHGGYLPEMTCGEFVTELQRTVPAQSARTLDQQVWIHFEGRVPETTTECVRALRGMSNWDYIISIECEKPDRKGLDDAAEVADVVFYSKLWAEVIYTSLHIANASTLTLSRSCMARLRLCLFYAARSTD